MKMKTSAALFPKTLCCLACLVVLVGGIAANSAKALEPPPNAASAGEWTPQAKRLILRCHGTAIFEAAAHAEAANAAAEAEVKLDFMEPTGERIEQRLKFTLAEAKEGVKLSDFFTARRWAEYSTAASSH